MESDVTRPPALQRAWFYLGGTVPAEYGSWVSAKLASRWRFLFQHVLGSIVLFACALIPLSLWFDLDRSEVGRVLLLTSGGLVVSSIVFLERFRRYAQRHALGPHRD